MKEKSNSSSFFLCLTLMMVLSTSAQTMLDPQKFVVDTLRASVKNEVLFYRKTGALTKSLRLAKKLVTIEPFNPSSTEVDYYRIGYIYNNLLNKKDSAYHYYTIATELAEKYGLYKKQVRALRNRAVINSDLGLYQLSDTLAIKGLAIAEDNGFQNYVVQLRNTVAINLNERGRVNDAINWYANAFKGTNDLEKKCRYLNNMAVNEFDSDHLKRADSIFKLVKNLSKDRKITNSLRARILQNSAFVTFTLTGKNIIPELEQAAQVFERENRNKALISNYAKMCAYYLKNDKRKLKKYALKMEVLASKINNEMYEIDAYHWLILAEDSPYRLKTLYEKRETLRKQMTSRLKQQQSWVLSKTYDADREKKKRLVSESKLARQKSANAEQALIIERENSEKQVWAFFGLFTLLCFSFYYFYERAKTKKEKIIEVYKTETRLAKKIHDELANDVYRALTRVVSGQASQEILIRDLENIYSQTRNISHEYNPVVTGEQFEVYLIDLFKDFSNEDCRVIYKGLSGIGIGKLSTEKQIVLYRICQELLVNMKKHSEASLVVFAFESKNQQLAVRYKDNGIGRSALKLKNGLENMDSRINAIGGSIKFDTEVNKGFTAMFHLKN